MKTLQDFRNYLIEEEKSELTVEKYLRDVHRFLKVSGDAEEDAGRCLEEWLKSENQETISE